jgi:pimeloyl-ACP methyl ester carboxylesterase
MLDLLAHPGLLRGATLVTAALLALAAALLLAHAAYVAWVRRRFPAEGARVPWEGATLRLTSRGQGPAVLLVHGMNGSAHDFPDALLDDLARDHRVIALDRPGHAGSTRGGGALDLSANARAVLAVLDALGVEHATLMGHSYGAAIALRLALDAPGRVAGLLLLAPCTVVDERNIRHTRLPLPPGRARRAALWLATLPVGSIAARRARREAWHPEAPPPGPMFSRAHALVPSQVEAAFENFHTLPQDLAALAAELPCLTAPLVVLVGAQDVVTPWRGHAAWLPGVLPCTKLRVLEGVGHWLPRQRPELVAAAVRAMENGGG